MNGFPRDVDAALSRRYDLIVIGGGIYGMCLTLEAAKRGLRPLLLERDDFGGATSLNSLRILHGGFSGAGRLGYDGHGALRPFESTVTRARL